MNRSSLAHTITTGSPLATHVRRGSGVLTVRALEKAKTLPVDGVIVDLEDSVAPETKETARKQAADAVKAGGFGGREVFIRINGVDSPWHADDLSAAARAAPDVILVPKVSNP